MLTLNKLDVLYLLQQFVSIGSLIYFGLFSAPQMPQLPVIDISQHYSFTY